MTLASTLITVAQAKTAQEMHAALIHIQKHPHDAAEVARQALKTHDSIMNEAYDQLGPTGKPKTTY